MPKGIPQDAQDYTRELFLELKAKFGTQGRVAEKLGIKNQSTISRIIETGRTSYDTLVKAAALAGRMPSEPNAVLGLERESGPVARYDALEQVIELPKNKGRWSKAAVESVRDWALESETDQDHTFWYEKLDETENALRKALPRRKVGPGEID